MWFIALRSLPDAVRSSTPAFLMWKTFYPTGTKSNSSPNKTERTAAAMVVPKGDMADILSHVCSLENGHSFSHRYQ